MKQMTCKQIGGPCDEVIKAKTSGEMATIASEHMIEAAKTDPAHAEAVKEMEAIYKDKGRHSTWEKDFHAKWEAAPTV